MSCTWAGTLCPLPTNQQPNLPNFLSPAVVPNKHLPRWSPSPSVYLPYPPANRREDNDDDIDGNPGDFLGTNYDKEFEYGHDAHGSSPLAAPPTTPILDLSPPILGTSTSLPKQRSAFGSTSFAPVAANPLPTMNDAVDADPDFFKGAAKDGEGLGTHFITMSFIKDKTKIQDQLLKALASTVSILSENIPGVLIHCIQKDTKPPLLSSSTASNFPTSVMQARSIYLFKIPGPFNLAQEINPSSPPPRLVRTVASSLMRIGDMMVRIGSSPSCGSLLTSTSRTPS
jgi:hypothetical protein